MNKKEFLSKLEKKLSGLPEDDIKERLSFYSEMIDDRMEEGLTEDQAVTDIGSVDELVSNIIADTSLTKIVRQRVKQTQESKTWQSLLVAPLWFLLLGLTFILAFPLFWIMFFTIWIVVILFIASALGCVVMGPLFILQGSSLFGLVIFCLGLILSGISIFIFLGFKAVKGAWGLTQKIGVAIKSLFIRKEN